MQSSMAVAGMDALSYPCKNILTRRANQRHYCIIAQFEKRPWPCPTRGCSARLQAKNPYPQLKLHRLATAKGRLSRCRAARTCHARAPRRCRREPSSDLNTATALASTWNHKSVLRPILRDGHGACHRARIRATRGDLLRMRSNSLKHNNLMLRSERRERLEAWAASDSQI